MADPSLPSLSVTMSEEMLSDPSESVCVLSAVLLQPLQLTTTCGLTILWSLLVLIEEFGKKKLLPYICAIEKNIVINTD